MADPASDWLPERHLGVAATLSHADELIGQVSDLLFAYQTQAQGVVGLREVPAVSLSRTVVERVAPIPRKVPLLVADALVALRAAIEHALFAEVEFVDGAPLDEKAAKLVEMPAADTYEKFENWKKQQPANRPPSLRDGSELVRRIAGLQPFHRRSNPELHPLARLVLYTNHAKHRTPAITAVRLAAMYQDNQPPHSIGDLTPPPEQPLRVGDIIAETPIGTRVPVTLFPTIGINRPGTDRWPVLMNELEEISHWVRTQAVPRLITGTEPPKPALPTRYEIAVGHDDERLAISNGSTRSAAARHAQRLSAAAARIDVVELIGRIDGAPSDRQIEVWLAQLTDDELLDRMSTLKPIHTYDPDGMRHNVKVVESLRDDALAFGHDNQDVKN